LAPFVGEISENVFVACGGCGYAAKSSDEIGRLAAHLSHAGEWVSVIPKEAMEPKFRKRGGRRQQGNGLEEEEEERRRKLRRERRKREKDQGNKI